MYRIHVSDVTEELNSVTFALVIRTADNITLTHGGGYVTLGKPLREADLDAAVEKIVAEGNNAFPKKLSQADRMRMRPVQIPTAHRVLQAWAWKRNVAAWPTLGVPRGRR